MRAFPETLQNSPALLSNPAALPGAACAEQAGAAKRRPVRSDPARSQRLDLVHLLYGQAGFGTDRPHRIAHRGVERGPAVLVDVQQAFALPVDAVLKLGG